MKKKIIITVVGLFVAFIITAGIVLGRDLSGMGSIELHRIDLSSVNDGSYTGTFEHGRFTNTLTVRVEGGRIVKIEIVDDVFAASVTNASGETFSRVIERQNTDIDAVTGATVTMNAYLMAIENAFEGET
jgi:uncharacterized protein with FMN-binding domain